MSERNCRKNDITLLVRTFSCCHNLRRFLRLAADAAPLALNTAPKAITSAARKCMQISVASDEYAELATLIPSSECVHGILHEVLWEC